MKFLNASLVKVFSGLLVVAGLSVATSANAQDDRYDDAAQLITGLAIGAVAGYVLIEASEGFHDAHYKGKHHHKHKRYHRKHHRHYRGCGHDRDYHVYRHHKRHDYHRGHGHGHYKNKYKYHDRGHHDRHYGKRHHNDRHGVYRIREDSHRGHGSHHRRVTVTHF